LQENKFNAWLKSIRADKKKLAIIEIGAGTAIPTVRNMGEQIAKISRRFKLIRINPRDFSINKRTSFSMPLGELEGLNAILGEI